MGGLVIDHQARVLGGAGQQIRGLFAAGEVTGVAGINGSHGGSGTFLGPSVLTGRIAGRSAAELAVGPGKSSPPATPATEPTTPVTVRRTAVDLPALLAVQREGYWHFTQSHTLVVERKDACEGCHQGPWPPGPATTREQRLVQLDSCTRCH
jgi:hypothetical protein